MSKRKRRQEKKKPRPGHKFHHSIPKSRFTIEVPIRKEEMLHKLIGNRIPEEIKTFARKEWTNTDGTIKKEILGNPDFQLAFGNVATIEAFCDVIDGYWRANGIIAFCFKEDEEDRRRVTVEKISESTEKTEFRVTLTPLSK